MLTAAIPIITPLLREDPPRESVTHSMKISLTSCIEVAMVIVLVLRTRAMHIVKIIYISYNLHVVVFSFLTTMTFISKS